MYFGVNTCKLSMKPILPGVKYISDEKVLLRKSYCVDNSFSVEHLTDERKYLESTQEQRSNLVLL